MLQIKGKQISKKPFKKEIFEKPTDKESPLTKSEIYKAFSLTPRSISPASHKEKDKIIKAIESETKSSKELLEKIEHEANKIHESLKILRKSAGEKSHEISEDEENNFEKSVNGYDSDPELYHYLKNKEKEKKGRSFSNQRYNKEVVSYKDYAENEIEKNQQKTLNFTIPKPFNFEDRETNKEIPISKKRFLEDQEERALKEKSTYNFYFRANPVPEHIKDHNLYEKIKKNQEQRRAEVKKNSKILTLQREKPFSFYLRDQNKIKKKTNYERKAWKMKARPIPWYCSVPLLQRMQEEEEAKRKERVVKEAQRMIAIAKLPARMEKHEQERRAKALKQTEEGSDLLLFHQNKNLTFHPAPRKHVPDFQKLQSTFQELLDRKRSNKRTVIPQPFDFGESKKTAQRRFFKEFQ